MKQTLKIYCKSCGGTGLYQGMAERDKCAVICSYCKGTGEITQEFELFEKRRHRENVERVFESSFGYAHSHEDYKTDEGEIIEFSKGGCSYDEWLAGAEPKPMKQLYCPYIYRNNGVGNEPLEKCKQANLLGVRISSCPEFGNKHKCWEEYEKNKIK